MKSAEFASHKQIRDISTDLLQKGFHIANAMLVCNSVKVKIINVKFC